MPTVADTGAASSGGPEDDDAARDAGIDDLEGAAGELEDAFSRLVRAHRRTLTWQAEELCPGMSLGSMKAFLAVCGHEPLSPSALAEHMMQDRAQVSRTVRELESHGLIRRDPDPQDRRSAVLTVTEEGRARLRAVRGGPDGQRLRRELAGWDPAEVRLLARLLVRFVEGREDADR